MSQKAPGPQRKPARKTVAKGPRGDTAREKKIDDAVDMTFPASDPTASGRTTGTEPAARPANRDAPVISKEDIERAAKRE